MGLLTEEIEAAGSNDLTIMIQAENDITAKKALGTVATLLKGMVSKVSFEEAYMTLTSALEAMPDANLAVISVPGEYAGWEARKALKNNLNLFLFSSNVSLEDEIALKKLAREKGLLVMGPDCGTAIINNVAIGFANVVKSGPIGVVAAAGTGLQQVTVLIDQEGLGITQGIGTGGRDLSKDVGGISMLQGIDMLDNDKNTKVIVLVSKPPSSEVMRKILERAASCRKPVVVNFLGGDMTTISEAGLTPALTLEEAAYKAVDLVKHQKFRDIKFSLSDAKIRSIVDREAESLDSNQKYIRGLYSGGTLCYEATLILKDIVGNIYSNAPLEPHLGLKDPWTSHQNTCVDLGAEEFVVGRPHPMIDPTIRKQRILQEANDPNVAVLLLDIVLGYGAHPDPAGALTDSIAQAKALAQKNGRYLAVVSSVCGTKQDPQDLAMQESKLRKIGVVVMQTNAQASRIAGSIATRSK